MASAQGGGPASSAPTGRRPRENNRQRLERNIGLVQREVEALQVALAVFGGPDHFDLVHYAQWRDSLVLAEYNATQLAERHFSTLQNLLATLADVGIPEGRKAGVHQTPPQLKRFQGLANLKVITAKDADDLDTSQAIRDADQHDYPSDVEQLTNAMLELPPLTGRFMDRYGKWFADGC